MLSQLAKFPQWGTVSAAIIPHICQLICKTEISNWANFADVLHKKFTPKMSNHSLLSGSPVLPVLCWNWDRLPAPVHTNHPDTSEAWIGNSVSYLNWTQILHKYLHTFSNITQIFTHFLQVLMVYKKVYNVSRKYQENWNKEHPINNQQKSHPFNVSDKYHVCLGSSTIKTDLQAMKQESCSRKSAIKHYHHQGETWKPKYQILKKCVGVKWPAEITLTLR